MANSDSNLMDEARLRQLTIAVERRAPLDAVVLLLRENDDVLSNVLERLDVDHAMRILACLPENRTAALAGMFSSKLGESWTQNLQYEEDAVGRLMEPVEMTFSESARVADVIELLRPLAKKLLVYAYVTDEDNRLKGVVAMRELLFAGADELIGDVMVAEPFYFDAHLSRTEAMRAVLLRHYPMYPVCDETGQLIGAVRGYALFEQQTYELTSQAGRMVGVGREEHLSTSWVQSLRMRHPWLQLNLLTALVAGAVVGIFEDTIAQVVALAAFLPVLAGQSGNTGCQALAVTLRAMILNELKPGMESSVLRKEALLGLSNGFLVGISAALMMLGYAFLTGADHPLLLAMVILVAMVGSCLAAGVAGAIVPLILRRFGADPATASTIFLTTATDVISMGAMLSLATIVLL